MKFLLTPELEGLARWLRLLGYDAKTLPPAEVPRCHQRAIAEWRILVTRDGDIQPHPEVQMIRVRSDQWRRQLRQVVRDSAIDARRAPVGSRCNRCNVTLRPRTRQAVRHRVPPYVYATQTSFQECPRCRRIFWRATHWGRITDVFHSIGRG